MSALSRSPGLVGSGNPKLSALRINGESQFIEVIVRALHEHRGNLAAAAKALHVSRVTMTKWVEHYPALRAARNAVVAARRA